MCAAPVDAPPSVGHARTPAGSRTGRPRRCKRRASFQLSLAPSGPSPCGRGDWPTLALPSARPRPDESVGWATDRTCSTWAPARATSAILLAAQLRSAGLPRCILGVFSRGRSRALSASSASTGPGALVVLPFAELASASTSFGVLLAPLPGRGLRIRRSPATTPSCALTPAAPRGRCCTSPPASALIGYMLADLVIESAGRAVRRQERVHHWWPGSSPTASPCARRSSPTAPRRRSTRRTTARGWSFCSSASQPSPARARAT